MNSPLAPRGDRRGGTGLLRWLPAVVWMGLIFYASSQPALPIDGNPASGLLHGIGHVVAYSVLAVLLRYALSGLPRASVLAFVIAIVYATTDELHQTFVPDRTGTVRDVLIDAGAAALALVILHRLGIAWRQLGRGGR